MGSEEGETRGLRTGRGKETQSRNIDSAHMTATLSVVPVGGSRGEGVGGSEPSKI